MEKSVGARKDSTKSHATAMLKPPAETRQANVENLRKNYKSERTEELKEIFRMYDKVNVGYINQTTLKFLLRGFGEYVDDLELSKRLTLMDEDGNGKIDSEEFLKYMMEEVNNESLLEDLMEVFRVFDKESLGVISPIKLKAITNGKVTDETIGDLLTIADTEEDGEINYEDYLEYLLEDYDPNMPRRSRQEK